MWRRMLGWLQWTIAFGLLPFAAVLLIGALHGRKPGFTGVFGSGEGLLIAVAWLAAGVDALHANGAAERADWIVWPSVVFMTLSALGYGALVEDDGTSMSLNAVAWISATDLAVSGLLSIAAVIV